MTADPRYLETLWNVASACFLQMTVSAGAGEARLLIAQERDLAWCLESVAQAIAISPDDDPRIASYQAWMASNFDAWTGDQVTTLGVNNLYGMNYTGMNTLGYTFAYNGGAGSGTAYGDCEISSFMQDFWMAAIGYARDLQAFPDTTAAADLAAYEAHLDGARIKTLGGSGAKRLLLR